MDIICCPVFNFGILSERLDTIGLNIDSKTPNTIKAVMSQFDIPISDNTLVEFMIGEFFNCRELSILVNAGARIAHVYAAIDGHYVLIRGTYAQLCSLAIKLSADQTKPVRLKGNSLSTLITGNMNSTAFAQYTRKDNSDGTYTWR